jgi:NTE family protein
MLPPWRLKVGLALGGGAARGLAHIGVLRALVREGIPIDIITGTSMGSVVGGAFAAMGDIAEIERRVRGLLASDEFQKTRMSFLRETKRTRGSLLYSVTSLVRRGIVYGVSTMRPSFVSAEKFAVSLGRILPDVEVSSTPIRFAASAVDLETAEEVVLCHGRLREVAAASAAIPGILPPRRLHGRLLIDGGWADKIPVLPAFRLGADIVIAVDISADLDNGKGYARGVDIVLRANMIKDTVMTELQCRLADIVIEPAVRKIHWADFESADFCIAAGDTAATQAAPKIRDLLRQERFRSMLRPTLGKRMAERYLASADLRFTMD